MIGQTKTFRYGSILFLLLLLVAGCVPTTAPESGTDESRPAGWAWGSYRSDCLGRNIDIPASAAVIDLSYSETPIETQLAESDLVVLGTVSQISHTCFNQDGGAFYTEALPYFEIRLIVEDVLQQNLELEAPELVLTQVGYSPLDDSGTSPFVVDDQAVAFIVDRELVWHGGEIRPILRPFDHFASSLLLAQPDGTFASSDGQTALSLEEIRARLTSVTEPEEQVLGCAGGGPGVFTPEDVRCYLNSFSLEFVREIDEETAVLFTDPDSMANWVGGAIIYHIPTVSSLVLDRHGEIDPQFSNINDRTAQLAYDRLTADAITMAEIKQRVQALWQTGEPELLPGLIYNGRSQGCGSIFVYKADDDDSLSEFVTIFMPAPDFSLSAEPLTVELADYPDQITVKIDLFGERVYNFGEFPYCNDVAPEAQPQSVWLAESGTLTVHVNGIVPEDTCAGNGFKATIRLENALFRNGEETVRLDDILFEDVAVGWCAG